VKILSRYLLREHFGPFAFALGALTGLLILNQVARQFAALIGKGLPWGVIGSVFALSLPFILAMTIPMAVLVAVLHSFTRLGADSEITALKAGGVNLARLVRPVLVAAALLAAGELLFLDLVLPRSNHRLASLLIDITRKRPTFKLREQAVNEVTQGQLFLRAGRIDQASDRMRNVVIYDLANPMRRRTIYADSGYIRFNSDQTDLFLTLFDGYIHDYDRAQAATFRRIFFGTDLVKVGGISNRLELTSETYRDGRQMSLCEMEDVVSGDMTALAGAAADRRTLIRRDALSLVGVAAPRGDSAPPLVRRHNATTLYCALLRRVRSGLLPAALRADTIQSARRRSYPANATDRPVQAAVPAAPAAAAHVGEVAVDRSGETLRALLLGVAARQRSSLQHAASYQVEIHKKYSLAVSCLVFVLIGAPVALRFPRGGIGLVIGASVVIFGFYYIGLIGGETLADRMIITPFWAMWTPNLVMALFGVGLFLRLGRETATTRGGGRARFFRWRRRRAAARQAA
jgi:lipopolysaccharide export system permease protein